MTKKPATLVVLGALVLLLCTVMIVSPDLVCANPITPPPPPPPINYVYIAGDGSIVPASAPIQRDGNTYSFIGNLLNSTVEVQRDNVIIDGAGFTIEGHSPYEGLALSDRNNVTVENVDFNQSRAGIILQESSNCLIAKNVFAINNFGFMSIQIDGGQNNRVEQNQFLGTYASTDLQLLNTTKNKISGNIMSNGSSGIDIEMRSSDNLIFGNHIIGKSKAIAISVTRGNTFLENIIENNEIGVYINDAILDIFVTSGNGVNAFTKNSFINNDKNIDTVQYSANLPLLKTAESLVMNCTFEYNYWSDYHTRYPNATEIDDSGIGNTPYVIDQNNTDNFPLLQPVELPSSNVSVPELSWLTILPLMLVVVLPFAVIKLIRKRKQVKKP